MQMAGLGYSEEQIELLDVATSFCRDKSPMRNNTPVPLLNCSKAWMRRP